MVTPIAIRNVLDRFRSELGLGEKPAGSNHNKITEWYNRNVDKIGDGPWCEMTATWAMWTGGARSLKKGRAYTVWGAQDGVDRYAGSSWYWGTKGMKAGDQVYYDWNLPGREKKIQNVDHTGMVEKINGDGTFYVLEGNTSNNKLERMRRDKKFVVGYVRFAWLDLRAAKPQPKPVAQNKLPKPVAISETRIKSLQKLLDLESTGRWSERTDLVATRMRNAARNKTGGAKKIPFSTSNVQAAIGTKVDSIWGDDSQEKLVIWVKKAQRFLGVSDDGDWGPKTDNAWLAFRKAAIARK